ncbi:hypothetical protein KP509_1Z003700 [Ceratopteris richardii]|nr:hypothetical protein KP509_1Z003700 [Ceratopteris richardii]
MPKIRKFILKCLLARSKYFIIIKWLDIVESKLAHK